jgi:hypothetical protein
VPFLSSISNTPLPLVGRSSLVTWPEGKGSGSANRDPEARLISLKTSATPAVRADTNDDV